MHAQDHHSSCGSNALSPTQGRRLAVGDRQKVSWLDVGSLSRSSTSRGWFARDRLVQVSQTAIRNCKQIGVAASSLEFSRLGNDQMRRLSSEFVARLAATFGVGRNHTDAKATVTGSRKGGSRRVHTKQYTQRSITLREPTVQCWSEDQIGRVPFTPIYLIPISPELSGNILLETSRNPGTFWTLLDYSGSF